MYYRTGYISILFCFEDANNSLVAVTVSPCLVADPMLVSLSQDLIGVLADNPGCIEPVQQRVLPTIISILQATDDKVPTGLQSVSQHQRWLTYWGHQVASLNGSTLVQVMACCLTAPSHHPDLPTLPHWAEAFRISRPASDLPHFYKIFRFQLKSDQHVFPVWTAMQLTWLSTSYHDHSSLSCPLISWGSVKTETLPALCNKNNKPIDLIHLRCG